MMFLRLPNAAGARTLLADLLGAPPARGPRRLDGPFALYGAGKLGLMAMDFFGHLGLAPELVVDANAPALRADEPWRLLRMLAPAQVPAEVKRSLPLVVSIATVCFTDLARGLKEEGWRDVIPLYDITEAYRDRYPLGNGWFMGPLDAVGQTGIARVLAGWSDDLSRAHHLQFMAWHRLRQDWRFEEAPVGLAHRYFIPEVLSVLNRKEFFVDAGAHRGETVQAFRHAVADRFEGILMLEPDLANAAVIERGLAELPRYLRDQHRLLRLALSDRAGSRPFFSGLGYASQVSSLGKNRVQAIRLDALNLEPSFIKLHLEGHEIQALQGGLETLRQHRPILAVTVYHSDAGVWRLPAWLMANLSDYRHYLRLHSWCGTGAIFYGIPSERTATTVDRSETDPAQQ